jgi:peptidoglycan-N-acetylmuramic acid deacetylase
MRPDVEHRLRLGPLTRQGAAWVSLAALSAMVPLQAAVPECPASRAVYLTFDTGHMGVAPGVAQVLKQHQVKATFFLANEATLEGGSSLDAQWAPWWQARALEGHVFASHTWDHWVWRGSVQAAPGEPQRWRFSPTAGADKGKMLTVEPQAYCEQLQRPLAWLRATAPQARIGKAFRAPAGRVSAALLQGAQACGYTHIPWTPAGFLGDELPSESHPNERLLQQALRRLQAGDVMLAHLGIWSRREPWAPAVLEPLIKGLKARGLCFATLADHPQYGAAWR